MDRSVSEQGVSDLQNFLQNTEEALRNLRNYLRSTVSDYPFVLNGVVQPRSEVSLSVQLQNAGLAAQISAELGHFSGLALDLRNWEAILEGRSEELNGEDRLAQQTALFRSWSLVRDARTDLIPRNPEATPIFIHEDEITERLRALREDILASVSELDLDVHETAGLNLFEARLDQAIDNSDSCFLSQITPQAIHEFLRTCSAAQILEGDIARMSGQNRFFRQIQTASLYAELGLPQKVREVLQGTEEFLGGLPTASDHIQGLLILSQFYQSTGMVGEANRLFAQISFIGQYSSDADLQESGTLAQAMRQLNLGDLAEAEETLSGISGNGTAEELLTRLQAGRRRQRLAQISVFWQAAIERQLEPLHGSGAARREAVERDLGLAFQEASRMVLSGEEQNFSSALRRLGRGEHCFLLDTSSIAILDRLSDLSLSDNEFDREVLHASHAYIHKEQYGLAGLLARSIRDRPGVGAEARRILTEEIGDALTEDQIYDQAHTLLYFIPGVDIPVIMHDVIAQPQSELGDTFMNIGLAMAGLGFGGWAGNAAEGAITASKITRSLSPTALRMTGWGARVTTEAIVFGGFNLGSSALTQGTTEHLTLQNFGREFGGNLVTFGLLRGIGVAMGGASAPAALRLAEAEQALVQAERTGVGIEAATARFQTTRRAALGWQMAHWSSRVGTFTVSTYLNEAMGLRDETNASFAQRLVSSALMDAEMMAAHRALNGLSRGPLDTGEREIQRRYAEREMRLTLQDLQANPLLGTTPVRNSRRSQVRLNRPVAPVRSATRPDRTSAMPRRSASPSVVPNRTLTPRRGTQRRELLPVQIDPGILTFINRSRAGDAGPLEAGLEVAATGRDLPRPAEEEIRSASESNGSEGGPQDHVLNNGISRIIRERGARIDAGTENEVWILTSEEADSLGLNLHQYRRTVTTFGSEHPPGSIEIRSIGSVPEDSSANSVPNSLMISTHSARLLGIIQRSSQGRDFSPARSLVIVPERDLSQAWEAFILRSRFPSFSGQMSEQIRQSGIPVLWNRAEIRPVSFWMLSQADADRIGVVERWRNLPTIEFLNSESGIPDQVVIHVWSVPQIPRNTLGAVISPIRLPVVEAERLGIIQRNAHGVFERVDLLQDPYFSLVAEGELSDPPPPVLTPSQIAQDMAAPIVEGVDTAPISAPSLSSQVFGDTGYSPILDMRMLRESALERLLRFYEDGENFSHTMNLIRGSSDGGSPGPIDWQRVNILEDSAPLPQILPELRAQPVTLRDGSRMLQGSLVRGQYREAAVPEMVRLRVRQVIGSGQRMHLILARQDGEAGSFRVSLSLAESENFPLNESLVFIPHAESLPETSLRRLELDQLAQFQNRMFVRSLQEADDVRTVAVNLNFSESHRELYNTSRSEGILVHGSVESPERYELFRILRVVRSGEEFHLQLEDFNARSNPNVPPVIARTLDRLPEDFRPGEEIMFVPLSEDLSLPPSDRD